MSIGDISEMLLWDHIIIINSKKRKSMYADEWNNIVFIVFYVGDKARLK